MKHKPKIEFGGFGWMRKCEDCGQMQVHFGDSFAIDGVCRACGSTSIKKVIARPCFTRSRWTKSHTYLPPQEKREE